MIHMTAKLICVLAGLWCLVALADRWGWTEPLWAKCWPQTILPRRPSPAEAHAADLETRLAAVRSEIAAANESLDASADKRQELVVQLRQRLGGYDAAGDAARLQTDNPVAFALVRSVDAEDCRQAETRRKLSELERQLARLEARQIATDNGVSLTDPLEPAGPVDELRAETGDESTEARYGRIVREATKAH